MMNQGGVIDLYEADLRSAKPKVLQPELEQDSLFYTPRDISINFKNTAEDYLDMTAGMRSMRLASGVPILEKK